jgi:hypothetical protein
MMFEHTTNGFLIFIIAVVMPPSPISAGPESIL